MHNLFRENILLAAFSGIFHAECDSVVRIGKDERFVELLIHILLSSHNPYKDWYFSRIAAGFYKKMPWNTWNLIFSELFECISNNPEPRFPQLRIIFVRPIVIMKFLFSFQPGEFLFCPHRESCSDRIRCPRPPWWSRYREVCGQSPLSQLAAPEGHPSSSAWSSCLSVARLYFLL